MGDSNPPLDTHLRLSLEPGERFRDHKSDRRRWQMLPKVRWSIYLICIGFGLYRILSFRPIPLDDTTGALRPLLYGYFQRYVQLFAQPGDAFSAWSRLCLVGLVSIAFLAVVNYLWRENLIRFAQAVLRPLSSAGLFWVLLAFTLLLCRVPILLKGELSPDESQFLASAEKLFYDPNFFRSVDCGTSGPLNIYPLMLPAVFGLSPDFASTRLVGLTAIFVSLLALYRALTLISSESLARLSILPVALTFAMFRESELVHYSSEHIPILLVSLSIFQGARVITDVHRQRNPNLFWLGFLASAAFFAKMQAVPIILSVGAVSLACLYVTGRGPKVRRSVWSGVAGLLVPILCIFVLCLQGGVFRDFWRTYVRGNLSYANAFNPDANIRHFAEYVLGLAEVRTYLFLLVAVVIAYSIERRDKLSKPAGMRFAEAALIAVAVSASILLTSAERSSVYAYIALVSICAAPFYLVLQLRLPSFPSDPVKWFGLLAVASAGAAIYSVYRPQRYYFHYLLFLYIPFGAFLGYFLIRTNGTGEYLTASGASTRFRSSYPIGGRLALLATTLVLTLSCEVYLWGLQDPKDFNVPATLVAAEGNLIRYLTSPGSEITVWGWNVNPYLSSGRVPATRDTNTLNLFQSYRGVESPLYVPTPRTERLSSIYRNRMLRDLQAHPPALFIDAIGSTSWFLHQREYWGFELLPGIKGFVDQRYVHLTDIYGQRYFMRRDLAERREAEFNQAMPQVSCSPSALLCISTAVTLPRELPPTQIPVHSRIDIEFMPLRDQLGPATIINTEKTPGSFRGLRLQHVEKERYLLLIGVGDRWVVSRPFTAPRAQVAFVSIELNGTRATLKQKGMRTDELHLPHPFSDAGGPVNVGSWIAGMDPFSGKVQFAQILDLDKEESRSGKTMRRTN